MTIANMSALDAIGARAIPEFNGIHDIWPRGKRLAAVREAGERHIRPGSRVRARFTLCGRLMSRRRRTRLVSRSTSPRWHRTCR